MGEKYSKLHGTIEPYNNFRLWYDPDPESPDSDNYYPLPYSNFYFRRFVELVFSRSSERSISYSLPNEFIGDGIDSDYIEELLIRAKDYGFFAPRAKIIFQGEAFSLYPPIPLGRKYAFDKYQVLDDKHHLLEIYEGSKVNKDRAKLIRKWLKRRAIEIAASAASPKTARPNKDPASSPAVTVASLCRGSFTLANLNELLMRLAVIDDGGKCLTNDLRGKARGKRGAFTAAYRVLHRAGLLAPTATDREWAAAFSREYEAELGADVIAHKLTQHGQAASQAPAPFQRAVDEATEWVTDWESRQKEVY